MLVYPLNVLIRILSHLTSQMIFWFIHALTLRICKETLIIDKLGILDRAMDWKLDRVMDWKLEQRS